LLAQLMGRGARLGLLLTGPGTHSAREIAHALNLPVLASLPDDSRTAALLSDGLGDRRYLARGSLIRAGSTAGQALRRCHAVPRMTPAEAGATR
jgi:hypothetical protein